MWFTEHRNVHSVKKYSKRSDILKKTATADYCKPSNCHETSGNNYRIFPRSLMGQIDSEIKWKA
jgi:hypothetical protein